MKISELISELEWILEKHGEDREVDIVMWEPIESDLERMCAYPIGKVRKKFYYEIVQATNQDLNPCYEQRIKRDKRRMRGQELRKERKRLKRK